MKPRTALELYFIATEGATVRSLWPEAILEAGRLVQAGGYDRKGAAEIPLLEIAAIGAAVKRANLTAGDIMAVKIDIFSQHGEKMKRIQELYRHRKGKFRGKPYSYIHAVDRLEAVWRRLYDELHKEGYR